MIFSDSTMHGNVPEVFQRGPYLNVKDIFLFVGTSSVGYALATLAQEAKIKIELGILTLGDQNRSGRQLKW